MVIRIFRTVIAAFLAASFVCSAAFAAEPKRVMVFHSFGRDFNWSEYAKAIRMKLDRQSPWPLEIIDPSLLTAGSADENPEAPFVEYRRVLFAKRPLDLIVSIGAPAASFVQRHRQQLFATTPMVFASVEQRRIQRSGLTENDVVVASAHDFPAQIENILHVLPDTKTVAFVLGASPNEKFWFEEVRRNLVPFAGRVSFIWYNDRSFADILKHAASLPPHSAIFWGLMNVDAAGVVHEGEALPRLYEVANAPIFTYGNLEKLSPRVMTRKFLRMILVRSRFDSVLFTSKSLAIGSCGNFSRFPLVECTVFDVSTSMAIEMEFWELDGQPVADLRRI